MQLSRPLYLCYIVVFHRSLTSLKVHIFLVLGPFLPLPGPRPPYDDLYTLTILAEIIH